MCPGGYVVAAASEEGRLVVNGMSEYARNSENANSACLCRCGRKISAMEERLPAWNSKEGWRKKPLKAGGGNYSAPIQRFGDFVNGRPSVSEGSVRHSYRPGTVFADLNDVLPDYVCEAIKEAVPQMGKRLRGFDSPDALMTGVETRSSSPVRIVRGDDGQSISLEGLYPTGEGAGYAGGIVSAAIDGVRQAEKIIEKRLIK